MDKIFYKNKLLGICLRALLKGSVPLTDPKEPLQVLTLKYTKNSSIKAHMHTPKKRITNKLQECLIIKKGKVKLDLYGPDKKFFKYIYLSAGDLFILIHGGYGLHFLQDVEVLEIKNGPFKKDKIFI